MSASFHVLLVDDNPADLLLAREAFDEYTPALTLTTCSSGRDALSYLRTPPHHYPDVIITDLNMPGFSGLDLIKALKEDQQLRRIPVVVLSTSTQPQDVADAYSVHASSYLVKAGDFASFVQQIDAFVTYWQGVQRTRSEMIP